ncbi:AMP-binding protein, partial [Campylobacter jejuni]
ERHRATSLQGVPTILAALAEIPLDGADISTLRYCRTGAAPLPAELAARFERLFGLHVNESLGMTEMAGITSITPPGSDFPV